MRAQFIRTLVELAEKDPRIILLSGDLGFTVIEPFVEKFPGRFFNIGVAEQNMIGIATGLAKEGFIPFAYSIVNFAALRSSPCGSWSPLQMSTRPSPTRTVAFPGSMRARGEYGTE